MGRDKRQDKADLLPGTLEMLILKSLDRSAEPMHGYGIYLYLKQISQDVIQVEEGSLLRWTPTEWTPVDNFA